MQISAKGSHRLSHIPKTGSSQSTTLSLIVTNATCLMPEFSRPPPRENNPPISLTIQHRERLINPWLACLASGLFIRTYDIRENLINQCVQYNGTPFRLDIQLIDFFQCICIIRSCKNLSYQVFNIFLLDVKQMCRT